MFSCILCINTRFFMHKTGMDAQHPIPAAALCPPARRNVRFRAEKTGCAIYRFYEKRPCRKQASGCFTGTAAGLAAGMMFTAIRSCCRQNKPHLSGNGKTFGTGKKRGCPQRRAQPRFNYSAFRGLQKHSRFSNRVPSRKTQFHPIRTGSPSIFARAMMRAASSM